MTQHYLDISAIENSKTEKRVKTLKFDQANKEVVCECGERLGKERIQRERWFAGKEIL